MNASEALRSQYRAAFKMLKEAVVKCPASVWDAPQDKDRFWVKVRHTLRYAHRDLRAGIRGFRAWRGRSWADPSERPSKQEVLEFLDFIEDQLSGDPRTRGPNFRPQALERMIAGIRHIQQHTGEIYERLGSREHMVLHWTESVRRNQS